MQVVVADHDVALFGEGGKGGVICLEAGAENHGGFFVDERSELGFQLDVHVERAVEKA